MASFILFDGSDTARTLNDGEFGFIAQTGSLATEDTAIVASGAVDVTVFGSLFAGEDPAIVHSGSSLQFYVGQDGAVSCGANDTVSSDFSDSASVVNDGLVTSGEDALDLRTDDDGGRIDILNTGTLSGLSDGVVTRSGDEATRIINHGVITGEGGVDNIGGDMLLVNFGEVSGDAYGFSGDAGIDRVRNFDLIEGGVFTEEGDDFVRNRGSIDVVQLGDGADIYNGAGGTLDRGVRGGRGEDELRGGAEADELRGESGADRLAGARGDDTLYGDSGGDRFVFAANGGFDTVEDFAGRDRIDLSALGLAGFAASVRDAIEEAADGAVIDLRADYDLQVFLRDVDAGDLVRGDFVI